MSTQQPSTHALAVLVVDDSADTVESVAELLLLRGHAVRVALNGEEALARVAESAPDVVLLDLRMPGLDGCAVARLIRARCAGAPKRPFLIAVTGSGSDADRLRSTEAGFDLHLVKPVDPAILFGLLERFRQLFTPPIPAPLAPQPEDPPDPTDDWFSGPPVWAWGLTAAGVWSVGHR
jgi:CheY-like chemotaxis protein